MRLPRRGSPTNDGGPDLGIGANRVGGVTPHLNPLPLRGRGDRRGGAVQKGVSAKRSQFFLGYGGVDLLAGLELRTSESRFFNWVRFAGRAVFRCRMVAGRGREAAPTRNDGKRSASCRGHSARGACPTNRGFSARWASAPYQRSK
jgi:hypothetical protein